MVIKIQARIQAAISAAEIWSKFWAKIPGQNSGLKSEPKSWPKSVLKFRLAPGLVFSFFHPRLSLSKLSSSASSAYNRLSTWNATLAKRCGQ